MLRHSVLAHHVSWPVEVALAVAVPVNGEDARLRDHDAAYVDLTAELGITANPSDLLPLGHVDHLCVDNVGGTGLLPFGGGVKSRHD